MDGPKGATLYEEGPKGASLVSDGPIGASVEESIPMRLLKNTGGALAAGADLITSGLIDMPLNVGMSIGGMARGESPTTALQSAGMATEDATKGLHLRDAIPGLSENPSYKAMHAPFEWLGEKVHQGTQWLGEQTGSKELGAGAEIAANAGMMVAPIPGAKLAGKLAGKAMDKLDPGLRKYKYEKPEPLPEPKKPAASPVEYKKPELAIQEIDTLKKDLGLEMPSVDYDMNANRQWQRHSSGETPYLPQDKTQPGLNPDQMPRTISPIEKTKRGRDFKQEGLEYREERLDNQAADLEQQMTGRLSEQERLRVEQEKIKEQEAKHLEEVIQRKIEKHRIKEYEKQKRLNKVFETRSQRTEPDSPLKYEMSLEDTPFREDLASQERSRIENIRNDFPTIDYELMPERVQKDSVIKGKITQWNNLQGKIRELYQRAHEIGLQGVRVREGELGKTKKSEKDLDALIPQISKIEEQLNTISSQIQSRMSSKHNVDIEGLPLWKGVKGKGSGKYAQTTPNMQRSPLGGVGKKQGGAVNFGFSEWVVDKAGKALGGMLNKGKRPQTPKYKPETQMDMLRSMTPNDNRNASEFVADMMEQKEGLRDISNSNLRRHVINPDSIANMAAKDRNPIISWVVSKFNDIDREHRMNVERAMEGDNWKPGVRGWAKRVTGHNGIKEVGRLPKESLERFRQYVTERANNPSLSPDHLSPLERKAVEIFDKEHDKALEAVNELLVANGQAPIAKREGFIPNMRKGDYIVRVKDADGKTVYAESVQNKWSAAYLRDKLQEAAAEGNTASVEIASHNKYSMNDISAFQMAHEMLGETKEGKLLAKVAQDVRAHRGFKKHGLYKEGVPGYMGDAVGKGAELVQGSEMYLRQAYEFVSDMKKKLAMKELSNAMQEAGHPLEKLPNTRSYLDELLGNSTSSLKDDLKLITDMVRKSGEITGLGPNAGLRAAGLLRGIAGTMWLTTGKFLEMTALQPSMGIPKMAEIRTTLSDTKSVTASVTRALLETYVPGMASAETKAAMTYAKKNGFIDSKFVDMMNLGFTKYDWAQKAVNTVPKHILGVAEQEMVRTPYFIAMNHLLKDVIKDPKERWMAAGRITESMMVNYTRTQAPAWFQRAGFVGENMLSMKQFGITAFGQLLDFTKVAIKQKNPAPLLTLLGIGYLLAGIRGMAPFPTINGAIGTINSITGADLPSVEEMLLAQEVPSRLVFGEVSTITGQNLSGGLAAPDSFEMGSMPGLEFAGGVIKNVGSYGIKSARGTATEADEMKAVTSVTPAQFREVIKNKYAREGQGVPDPNKNMKSELPPRDSFTKAYAAITAAEPIEETVRKSSIRAADKEERRQSARRGDWKDKLINDYVQDGKMNKEAMNEYIKEGGDPNNLVSTITTYMVDDIMSYYERKMMRSQGITLKEAKERLHKYKLDLLNTEDLSPQDLVEEWKKAKP